MQLIQLILFSYIDYLICRPDQSAVSPRESEQIENAAPITKSEVEAFAALLISDRLVSLV